MTLTPLAVPPRPGKRRDRAVLINGTPYLLVAVREDKHINREQPVIGYRLAKVDGTPYDLQPDSPVWHCDCPDFEHNRQYATTPETRECKHIRALRAALNRTPTEE